MEDLREEIREEGGEFGEFASRRQRHRLRPASGAAGEAEPIRRVKRRDRRRRGLRIPDLCNSASSCEPIADPDVQSLGRRCR